VRSKMADKLLEVLVVHKMPDGTFAAAGAVQKLRIGQDAFKSAAEAESH
jgi:hypothetical protein